MKIHAFNFTCKRDSDLSALMADTLMKYCENVTQLNVYNTDYREEYKGYENGAGWKASMMKLKALGKLFDTDLIEHNDFVLSVDSDVLFCSSEVFNYVDPKYGIIGVKHKPEFNTLLGTWSHMSGCLIFIRADIAKKMSQLSENILNTIRYNHFKPYSITENEDIVLSYLAEYCGAKYFELPSHLTSGNFESEVHNQDLRSFYHLNYCPTQFLGEEVTGKWDIPKVLEMKGIKL
jgi:lipopolysaccharide biosynthesis glycosyltransferase